MLGLLSVNMAVVEVEAKVIAEALLNQELFLRRALRFHLEDEISARSIGIGRVEHAGVRLEAAASLVPLRAVEVVEVIAPVKYELVMISVVREDLHVVV